MLSSADRKALKARAHKLEPVVLIGAKGLTDEVVSEVDKALKAHELIKVRAMTDDRDARGLWMEKICERLQAEAIQRIGKVLVLYRENFDKAREPAPEPELPAKRKRRGTDDPRKKKVAPRSLPRGRFAEREATRTSRPRSRTPSAPPESVPRRRRRSTSQ
jgi:putative YhbY family RNA-binding protein